jgi:hypothetical protein
MEDFAFEFDPPVFTFSDHGLPISSTSSPQYAKSGAAQKSIRPTYQRVACEAESRRKIRQDKFLDVMCVSFTLSTAIIFRPGHSERPPGGHPMAIAG